MTHPEIIGIIDDDDIYRFMTVKTIQSMKLPTKNLTFTDGEEALEFIIENMDNKQKLPDVILLDVNMPVLDGFGFMQEFIKVKPLLAKRINIFMISSSANPADMNRAKSIPDITDYFVKPIEPGKLMRMLAGE